MAQTIYHIKFIIIFQVILLITTSPLQAQSTAINKPAKPKTITISTREVLWAIAHPFIAHKVFLISKEALQITDSIEKSGLLKDRHGGNLDAFKHCLWMALLAQNIKARKAKRIGIIHEKVNYKSFKKGNNQQDSTASLMDSKNNTVGILLGKNHKHLSKNELIALVILYVKQGKLFKIKKDRYGNYLDANGNAIEQSVKHCWNKKKHLTNTGI